MDSAPIRLLLVDDDWIARAGLRTLLANAPHLTVDGEAASVTEAITLAQRLTPDVVLLDVRLPDGSGIEACRQIRLHRPHTRVLMLTVCADEDAVIGAILAGAAGYLLKSTAPERLVEAIEQVAAGHALIDPAVTAPVFARLRRHGTELAQDDVALLSPREQRILTLIAEGKTNRQIAAALYLSEYTVRTYVSKILQKLGLARRTAAAAFFAQQAAHTAAAHPVGAS